MTELLEHPVAAEPKTIEKVAIVVSKGSLEDRAVQASELTCRHQS
jgi:hypothetical protein